MKCLTSVFALVIIATSVQAHSPWVVVDDQGKLEYFFGEGMTERNYKLPEAIAKAEIMMRADGKLVPVETKTIDSDDFIGKRSVGSVPKDADIVSQATYGVYHGSKLQYYTQHLGGEMPKEFSGCKPFEKMDFQAHAVDTDEGVDVYVLWKGKPLEGAGVQLFCEDGHQEGSGETDASGKVSFNDKQVEDGMNAIMVLNSVSDDSGEVDGEAYGSAMHFLTATFADPEDE